MQPLPGAFITNIQEHSWSEVSRGLDPPIHDQSDLWHACTSHTQPFYGSPDFVRDNPGELVSEETFTHSHLSWSSIIIIPYLLPPSIMILGIISVQFPQSLSKFSSVYLLAWYPPLDTPYISSPVGDLWDFTNLMRNFWSSRQNPSQVQWLYLYVVAKMHSIRFHPLGKNSWLCPCKYSMLPPLMLQACRLLHHFSLFYHKLAVVMNERICIYLLFVGISATNIPYCWGPMQLFYHRSQWFW